MNISVSELNKAPLLSAFPNPTRDVLLVRGVGTGDDYFVLDATGRTVMRGVVPNGRADLDVSLLTAGTYMLRVEREGNISHLSFVKE